MSFPYVIAAMIGIVAIWWGSNKVREAHQKAMG